MSDQKNRVVPSFLSDLTKVAKSNVVILLSSILGSVVTARALGPEGNGIIAGLVVYPSLFMTVGSLGIRQTVTYHSGKGIFSEAKIKTAITQIWVITAISSFFICSFLMKNLSSSGDNWMWIALALVPIPFNLFIKYNSGIFLGKNDIAVFNRINWVPSLTTSILVVILVGICSLGITGALVAACFGPLLMALILLFKHDFLRAFKFSVEYKIIKSILSLGLIYAFALLVINLNYKIDILLLDKMSSPYELGIYSKGASLTQYLWQIPMVLNTIIFARSATSSDPQEFSQKVAQLLRISIIIISLASLLLFVFADGVISIMFGADFIPSAIVVRFLLPGVIVLTVFKVMNTDLAGRGKPWISLKAMLPALFINVILNLIYIPLYGSVGAALSSTVSYTLAGLLFLYFYSKEVGIPVRVILRFSKKDFTVIYKSMERVLAKYAG